MIATIRKARSAVAGTVVRTSPAGPAAGAGRHDELQAACRGTPAPRSRAMPPLGDASYGTTADAGIIGPSP